MERLNDARSVLRILGLGDLLARCDGADYRVDLEGPLEEGLAGRGGQIDLLIHFGGPVVAMVGANVEVRPRDRHGFRFRTWEEVSIALRREIARHVRGPHELAIAAMMLAFVAAIEQNLLGFGTTAARRAVRDLPTLFTQRLSDYLRKTLDGDS